MKKKIGKLVKKKVEFSGTAFFVSNYFEISFLTTLMLHVQVGQGQWSLVRRVRICAPNVFAMSKENRGFAHPIFGPYFMNCAPNIRLLPPPLISVM